MATSTKPIYDTLDECINDSTIGEMCTISSLLRGKKAPAKKRRKNADMKPVVWVRFYNHANNKAKPITLKALLDSRGAFQCTN